MLGCPLRKFVDPTISMRGGHNNGLRGSFEVLPRNTAERERGVAWPCAITDGENSNARTVPATVFHNHYYFKAFIGFFVRFDQLSLPSDGRQRIPETVETANCGPYRNTRSCSQNKLSNRNDESGYQHLYGYMAIDEMVKRA
jgi:hypothetical protein